MQEFSEKSYFEILDVAPTASPEEISAAYNRARQIYTSDNPALKDLFSQDEARALQGLIEEAYKNLCQETGGVPMALEKNTSTEKVTHESKDRAPQYGLTRYTKYLIDDTIEAEIAGALVFSGPLLEKIRKYKGVTYEQMIDATRVNRTYLAAIEKNDFGCLPAVVFLRGFLVQVAKVLGLDPQKVSTSYLSQVSQLQSKK